MAVIDRTNQPDTPEVKLRLREQLAREHGKLFDENLERRVLGLPEVANPVVIAESEKRARRTRAEVKDAIAETTAEAKAQAKDTDDVAALKARIAALEAQVAGQPWEEPPSEEDDSAAHEEHHTGARPDDTWTAKQLMNYAKSEGIALPRGGTGMSKLAILDMVLGALDEREKAAEPEPVTV